MRIATWNVNSVKSRLHQLLPWLNDDKPDIILLQETKTMDDGFPAIEIEELGYNLALSGQKTYNGVAILSKFPLEDVVRGLPGSDTDTEARYIEAVVSVNQQAVRVASVYVPNGQTPDSEKFPYKLNFLERFHRHMQTLLGYGEITVIGGDYNIAPFDIDVHNPAVWANTVLCHPEVRKRLRATLNLGWYDAYRLANPQSRAYSWWDYRANAFEMDAGLRIDHLLISAQAADRLQSCEIAKTLRAFEKPSDHVPVIGDFKV